MHLTRKETELTTPEAIEQRIADFLEDWLGQWPPQSEFDVVRHEIRDEPGWDGEIRRALGVETPGGTVLSVIPGCDIAIDAYDPAEVCAAMRQPDAATAVPVALGVDHMRFARGACRFSVAPTDLPRIGVWVAPTDPRLPEWLRSFSHDVLVALDGDTVMSGVGVKHHHALGREIAVGTEPNYEGRGLASVLVAQAAHDILEQGAVPMYLHAMDNAASGRVADKAGFPDRGWRFIWLSPT